MTVGYYGKLPDRGDFVSQGVSHSLEKAIDRLGATLISRGREAHGEAFPDAFAQMSLHALWSAPGALADEAVTGLMGPSADSVGRLFPFFVLTENPIVSEDYEEWCTAAAQIVDQAAFEKTPLTDVEAQLAELTMTRPEEGAGLVLREWTINGPGRAIYRFADLEEACASPLPTVLMGGEA